MQSTHERIRLTTLRVTVQQGEELHESVVSIRHGWDGADPDHACDADLCESCTNLAGKKAIRKLDTAGVVSRAAATATAFEVLRDGQANDDGYVAQWPGRNRKAAAK